MTRSGGPDQRAGLAERVEALTRAVDGIEGIVGTRGLDEARAVIARAQGRAALSIEHTVVGFLGATGSGKSSLLNAVVGAEIARAAVRRPTTSEPLAAVLGAPGSEALLDWIDVPERHLLDDSGVPLEQALLEAARAPRRGLLRRTETPAAPVPGLVLLDLPDLDSVAAAHRRIAERMAGLVDVLVWVTDPQKYADDLLHHEFVEALAAHDATTLVVLNQVDRIADRDRQAVLASLTELVRADGLEAAPVLGVSAATGEGIEDLRERCTALAVRHDAAAQRVRTDVREAALRIRDDAPVGTLPADVRPADVRALTADLGAAARVGPVADAVAASYRHRAARHVGWPMVRWLGRLRPDPLGRLGIGRTASSRAVGTETEEVQTSRTSLPAPDAATAARASGGLRRFAESTSEGASDPWRAAVRRAARSHEDALPDALDQAVAGADLRARTRPWWWHVLSVIQWLALALVVAGLGWLVLLAVLGFLQVPAPPMPMVEGLWIPVPLPTALLVLGLGIGVLVATAGTLIAALAATAARRRARRVLEARVAEVAERLVVAPVEDVLDLARDVATDLSLAAGGRR
ncbi:dynamin family protein [Brachybacterium sp. AOP25-B2-12]|uniref:dynamin family protein n=1 Tax=Brachybacterium sp. AOP25-B2-12 TaxID=3457710 RepID=UPI0040334A5C